MHFPRHSLWHSGSATISNLALDPDLDSYYVQNIVVRRMPSFLGRLTELQQFFEASIAKDPSSPVRQVRLANSLKPGSINRPRGES